MANSNVSAVPATASVPNPNVSGAVSAGGSIAATALQGIFNSVQARKQREWNEKMMDKQNQWSLDMWNRTNEYNSPSAQVQRLRDAGLNPLYYGLDGSSANALESAQPLGYDRANMNNVENPLAVGVQNYLQAKTISKDIELKNAQIDKLKEEESGIRLDNEWKDKTMAARVESENLANNLTRKQIDEVDSRIKVNAEEVKKKIQETDNLVEQKGLIIAERILTESKNKEIVEMLPYNKLLVEAQTSAQKANAALAWAHQAIQKGLLEAGYVDKMIEDLSESVRSKASASDLAEINKAINEFKLKIRNGSIFEGYHTIGSASGMIQDIMNSLMSALSIAGEAIGGGLSGVIK